MIHTIVAILVIGLICGGIIYVVDRVPFIVQPFNAIIKVITIIGGIILALKELGLFKGFAGML